MKRLVPNEDDDDDLHSCEDKTVVKDWDRRDDVSGLRRSMSSLPRSSSYYKPSDSGKKVLPSFKSRYEDGSRMVRRRSDYDLESYDRRRGYDRQREGNERGVLCSSPKGGFRTDHLNRSQSFSSPKRDFPQDFRSERYRPKREEIAASWRRFGSGKHGDDGGRSSDSGRRSRMELKNAGKAKSPRGLRDAKSPALSKDSGSEHSKSVDSKRCVDMLTESSAPSSEREEGELEPDHQPHVPSTNYIRENEAAVDSSEKDLHVVSKVLQDEANIISTGNNDDDTAGNCEEQVESGQREDAEGMDTSGFQDKPPMEADVCHEKGSDSRDDECSMGESTKNSDTPSLSEKKDNKGLNDQINEDANTSTLVRAELPSMKKANQSLNDKGKGVALLPSGFVQFSETTLEFEDKLRALQTSRDIDKEGTSTRGFQFFSTDPINKPEADKQLANTKDDKLALELSLCLPNVLLPIGQTSGTDPGSPSQTRSFQSFPSSFRTLSEGFTASISFSGSQQFTHNPSCSLNHNLHDTEQSVKSRPLFQGVDWKALASDENKNKDFVLQKKLALNAGYLHQQSDLSKSDANAAMVQHLRFGGESSKQIGFDTTLSLNRHLSGGQSFGTFENGSEYSKERKKFIMETDTSNLQKKNSHEGKTQPWIARSDFAESIVTMAVSEPINTMSQKFSEMSPEQLASVKEFIHEIIANPAKKWRLSDLQKTLLMRQDISLDMLLNAHRSQLETLVALKTGLAEFILKRCDIPTSELAEIFLNMRCRNLKCKSLLPVDECDCKICSKRSDFCRECMCLVCSKYDNAANTCSWVGCDVCLHWCHADCGLKESHIRNGCSVSGALRISEVYFYCVACGHPSEMFGFVKEVFLNFVNEWTAENLSHELEYVRRIFCGSEDPRGKQLHELALRMKSGIAARTDLRDVQKLIVKFFSETTSDKPGTDAVKPVNDPAVKIVESGTSNPSSSQRTPWLKYQNEDIRKKAPKVEPPVDELESIVKIKLAEANMFQARADDARREGEALKRIVMSKNERVEEEYSRRVGRLGLPQAEEMRKQKIEELQGVEGECEEYLKMKTRMESDIKELLLKMEAKRRSLGV